MDKLTEYKTCPQSFGLGANKSAIHVMKDKAY